jgi:hypothetical protein
MVKVATMVLALVALPALSACSSFHPVYGIDQFTNGKIELALASPNNRVEQIIYQDLALHFARTSNPDAPKLIVSANGGAAGLLNNTVTAAHTEAQATVSAAIVLTNAKGDVLFSGTRAESADYTNGPQVLANNQAYNDAATRAAHLLADSIRLSVLGALSKQ